MVVNQSILVTLKSQPKTSSWQSKWLIYIFSYHESQWPNRNGWLQWASLFLVYVVSLTQIAIGSQTTTISKRANKIEYFSSMDIVKLGHLVISCGSQRVWKVDVMCVRNTPFHCIYWAFCELREAQWGRDQLGLR